jgi:outer membrane protein OmpA-like peptidoglycan-associated protein
VTVKSDVLFDVNSSSLTAEASSRLGAFLTLAARDPNRRLLVEGFTDSDGDAGFNQQLSEARAQSVAQWLIGQGIDPARITAVGHGADNPVAPNDTPENKALNRRVVVTLLNAGS